MANVEANHISRLALSCTQACASEAANKDKKNVQLRWAAKRDFYVSPHDPEGTAPDPLGEPMTIREVAHLFRCSIWTVRQRHLQSGLPHFRIGQSGKLLFYRKQVVQWILENQIKKGGDTE